MHRRHHKKNTHSNVFRLLSYNILADHLVKREGNYFEFELPLCEGPQRMENMINKEIDPLKADIIMLQEVVVGDTNYSCLVKYLTTIGYQVSIID